MPSTPNPPSRGSSIENAHAKVRDPAGPWRVTAAPLARLADLAPLALGSASEERKTIVLSLLADLLRRSAGHDLYLAEVLQAGQSAVDSWEAGSAVAAAIAIRTAGDSASLLAVDTLSPAKRIDRPHLIELVLGHLHRRLATAGVTFIQAMREAEVEQAELVGCGYEFLATLDYLVAPRHARAPLTQPPATQPSKAFRAVPYETYFRSPRLAGEGGDPQERLAALIDATYIGSLDCPQMERFRSAASMVDTYRGSPAYDPAGWLILVGGDGQAIGCLLSTPHPGSGSLEITYMGLIPEARRMGYAAATVERAWELAQQRGLSQLTLAVDRANCPAIKLYRRHGFEPLISETVWGRSLGLGPEISAGLKSCRSGV